MKTTLSLLTIACALTMVSRLRYTSFKGERKNERTHAACTGGGWRGSAAAMNGARSRLQQRGQACVPILPWRESGLG